MIIGSSSLRVQALIRSFISASISSSNGQAASFSDNSPIASGHVRPEPRVVVAQASLHARRVELADLVARFGRGPERLVAVREPLGHVQRAVVVGGEFDLDVLEECRALRAQSRR